MLRGKTFVTNLIFLFLVIKSYFLSQFIAYVLSQYWLCTTRFMALQCTMQDGKLHLHTQKKKKKKKKPLGANLYQPILFIVWTKGSDLMIKATCVSNNLLNFHSTHIIAHQIEIQGMLVWALWNARNTFYFWGEIASPKLGNGYGWSTTTRLRGDCCVYTK